MVPSTRASSQVASSRRAQPPATHQPSEDASADEPSTQLGSTSETLEERIQAAERRRNDLLNLQRLQALEAEISHLESLSRGSPAQETIEGTPEPSIHATHKRNASPTLPQPHPKRTIKPKDPSEYKGKNLKEHREFVRSCEVAFQLLPHEFQQERDKVLWAMQFLAGDPRELWYTHHERTFNAGEETHTWEYFKKYLLDLLSDPINRTLEAATSHAQAMQRKDQTVRAFATYLDVLEDQLPPYTEEQRVQHLFSKLKPEIQRAITNYHQVPSTREDLIALGSTLERNLRRSSADQDHSTRNKSHNSSKDQKHKGKTSNTGNKPPQDKSKITCFKCNKKGHYANECNSGNQGNPNHIPVRINQAGKDKASPTARGQ